MSDMDRMQEINVDFSQFIKKNLKKIKMLPKDKQKEFGRLLGDFKEGLDNLSEGTYESVSEMQMINKKTGKDVTRHVLDLLQGKISKKEFEKLTGLKK
jgi:hypothetical protein